MYKSAHLGMAWPDTVDCSPPRRVSVRIFIVLECEVELSGNRREDRRRMLDAGRIWRKRISCTYSTTIKSWAVCGDLDGNSSLI